MRLPPALLLAGVARTLEFDVLPAVTERAARGLVFAALEVLANVQDLVEWKAEVRDEELGSAAAAGEEAARLLEHMGLGNEAASLRTALAAAGELTDREARGRALDAALDQALAVGDAARGRPGADAVLAAVRAHLVNQTVRDLMRTQRPLLDRISQG
jgi:hypothetical protein